MKTYLVLVVLFLFVLASFAQSRSASEHRPAVVKSEGGWNKADSENAPTSNAQTIAEGIVFSTNSDGIFITLPKAVGNVFGWHFYNLAQSRWQCKTFLAYR